MAGRGGTSRLLGLGFMFGAKDDGAVETTKKLGEGMDELADATDKAAGKTSGLLKFGNAINSLNFLQLDRLGNAMEGLADKAGVGPGGAANSIESFGVQFGKSFREATAGLGKYTAGVQKYRGAISGAAFNLEVDAGELTRTTAAFVKTGNALEDYGLNIRSVAGSMQAGILSGDQLSNVLTGLSEGYDMGARGAGRHLDKITALGEQFGMGKEAAQGLEAAIAAANPVLARFTDMKVDNVTESITRLALATQRRVGGTFQDSMQAAIGTFSQLSEARGQMTDLVTGLGNDFPQLAKEIGISTGDIGGSMQAILSDPLTFAKHMRKLMSQLDQNDPRFKRLQGSLKDMPDNFRFLITGGEESAKALEAASRPIKNFEGAFGKMAKSSSGAARTFAERMDLLKERHENALNKMTSQTDSHVVRRQAKAYKRLGKVIDGLTKGPMGGFFQLALDIRRHGFIHGLIPAIDKIAGGGGPLAGMAKRLRDIMPMFDGFGEVLIGGALAAGKLAILIGAVSGPLGKFGGIIKSMFAPVTKLAKRAFGPLAKHMSKKGTVWMFLKGVPRLIPGLGQLVTVGMLIYAHWDKFRLVAIEVWKALREVTDTVSADLAPAFEELGRLGGEAWENIKVGAETLWEDHLKPFGKWLRGKMPAAFGVMTSVAVGGIGMIVEGAKFMGKAFKLAFDVALAGAQMMMSLNPIGLVMRAMQALMEYAGKTTIGKKLGLDQMGEDLALFTDQIPEVGKSFDALARASKSSMKELGQAGAEYWKNMERVGEKAAVAGLNVERGVMTAMAGPSDEEAPAKPRRVKRKKRRGAKVMADRMEATVPAVAGGPADRFAAGGDLTGFLKGMEGAVAKGAAKGSEMGIKKGVKRIPGGPSAGGSER